MSEKPTYKELEQRIRALQSANHKYKKALKASKGAEEKYRSLFNNSADVIIIIDMNGNLLEANSSFGVKSGYNKEQLIGENLINSRILTEESIALAIPYLKDIIEGKNRASIEINTRRSDGQIVPYDAKAAPIKKNDTIVAVQIILRNISIRKQMEVELVEERNKLKEALAKIKILSGLLPICSHCKKIRDDKGYWNKIELYIQKHSDAEFSHGICPECAKKYYPDMDLYGDEQS